MILDPKPMKKFISIICLLSIFRPGGFAQPGILDASFGTSGTIVNPFPSGYSYGKAVAIQSDGRIVVAGNRFTGSYSDAFVMRFLPDGTTDPSFGTGGSVTTAFTTWYGSYLTGVAIQPDGKIVVGGYIYANTSADYLIARYDSTGVLDPNFGTGGFTTIDFIGATEDRAFSLALQPDGKIVLAGSREGGGKEISLMRFQTNGMPDNTFGYSGQVVTDIPLFNSQEALAIALQVDGKLVITGWAMNFSNSKETFVARFKSDGDPDSTFNSDGFIVPQFNTSGDEGHAVLVQQDGKILVSGQSYDSLTLNEAMLLRFDSAGNPDNTFNGTGIVLHDIANKDNWSNSIIQQPDGKIVSIGVSYNTSHDLSVTRFNVDGTVDLLFGNSGTVNVDVANDDDFGLAAVIQPDQKIVVTGSYYDGDNFLFMSRHHNDSTFVMGIPEPEKRSISIYPNPADNFVTVTFIRNSTVRITDIFGRPIIQFSVLAGKQILDITDFARGVYFLTDGVVSTMLLKQ